MHTTRHITALSLLVLAAALTAAACDDGGSSSNTTDDVMDVADGEETSSPDVNLVDVIGVTNCEADDDCDDGNSCTTDACVDSPGMGRVCSWELAPGACFINNVCVTGGGADPANGCRVCDPEDPLVWSNLADGDACQSGDACTLGSTCSEGVCGGGEANSCDDDNPCTLDRCDADEGCVHEPISDLGVTCDDDDPCTDTGYCDAGACVTAPVDCSDGNTCTDDSCDSETGECVYTNNTAPCDDGLTCTIGSVCADGECQVGTEEGACDDGNECTIDTCDETSGCTHLPTNNPCCIGASSVCEDNNPCTDDICNPDTAECSYSFNTGPCDDGNLCTEADTCDGSGACAGTDRSCDDGNPCTDDTCNINAGCVTKKLDAVTCDDGRACSTGDTCDAGVCVADTSQCLCTRTFDDASKLTTLAVGANENEGEALDINADGARDNALAPLGGVINEPLQTSITDGDLMLVYEFQSLAPDFILTLIPSVLDPANDTCDYQTATCDYLADRAGLEAETCNSLISLDANLSGDLVTAGGPDVSVPFSIPLDATSSLDVTIYMVNLEMTIVETASGVTEASGILAGAVTEEELGAAILSLDPASVPGGDPAGLVGLVNTLAPNDIDTDGDGTLDAKSISLKFSGIDGNLVGLTP